LAGCIEFGELAGLRGHYTEIYGDVKKEKKYEID
jgi:hypothetical protein